MVEDQLMEQLIASEPSRQVAVRDADMVSFQLEQISDESDIARELLHRARAEVTASSVPSMLAGARHVGIEPEAMREALRRRWM